MNRRDFFLKGVVALLSVGALAKESFAAAVEWVKPGTAGYKEVADKAQKDAGRICSKCKWYTADAATPGAGICKQVVISKGKQVHVKGEGFCPMFLKA